MRLKSRISVQVKIDVAGKSQRAAEAAARIVFPELNSAFQDAIGSPVWQWPRETVRGSTYRSDGTRTPGKVVGSPRNIVDLGTLRASNYFNISGTMGTFRWAVGHATAVHYGANIYPWGDKTRTVNLPARPWTDAVLGKILVPGIETYNYKEVYKAAFISAWKRQR